MLHVVYFKGGAARDPSWSTYVLPQTNTLAVDSAAKMAASQTHSWGPGAESTAAAWKAALGGVPQRCITLTRPGLFEPIRGRKT